MKQPTAARLVLPANSVLESSVEKTFFCGITGTVHTEVLNQSHRLEDQEDVEKLAIGALELESHAAVKFLVLPARPVASPTPETSNRVLTEFGPDDASHRCPETSVSDSGTDAILEDLFFNETWETIFDPLATFEPHKTPSSLGLESPHLCQLAADRMVSELKDVASAHPRYFEKFDPDHAQNFFCSENVADSIGAYFQRAHIPIRIIHRSCFYLETVSTSLLLSVFLIGTICQPVEKLSPLTIKYADIIEWSVFEDPQFLRLMYMKQEENPSQIAGDKLEFVQAALLVIIVQSASPSTEVRRRIRVVRVPALLAVARALSLTKVQSRWNDNYALLDHRIFIEDETRIRTMCLVFVMDCRFVMFYNNPPYLNPLELQFDLPAGDEGIDIADDKSWEPWALDQRSRGRPPSMNELMQALMCNQWTGPGDPQFGNLSIFNMLLLMLGFHSIIFGIRNSFCDMSNARIQVDRGLTRWKDLWNRCLERSSADQIRRAGFMVQAAQDLWHYAGLLLRTPTSKTGPIANDTITNVHRVLKEP
ncbi:transcriptional regulator family: Fungal Specific TF [Paecilomyces variotii]|nr:transcriptional regulator family: Fungal Specific TF [Paecilomyces variotii]KAJ9370578.1 transcriptional regulator family: Fungal Specific TF [Paecilomyces variotii]